jgi:hypothetical protein
VGQSHIRVTRPPAARMHAVTVAGAAALLAVAAAPASAAGIGVQLDERITEWPVAAAIGAALVFATLAVVFALLARSSRRRHAEAEAAEAITPRPLADGDEAVAEIGAAQVASRAAKKPAKSGKRARSASKADSPLRVVPPPGAPQREPHSDPLYTQATCEEYVEGLGDEVLERSLRLFQPLGQLGRIDSYQLAELLDAPPASIGGMLTTPLSRRADGLGLPLPYVIDRVPGTRRRVWRDHAGIAARMARAIRAELALRDDPAGAARSMSSDGEEPRRAVGGRR